LLPDSDDILDFLSIWGTRFTCTFFYWLTFYRGDIGNSYTFSFSSSSSSLEHNLSNFTWSVEFGCSEATDVDKARLEKLSPVRNIQKDLVGLCYPAVLVVAADCDDPVAPQHSLRYFRELQIASTEGNPNGRSVNPHMLLFDTEDDREDFTDIEVSLHKYSNIFAFVTHHINARVS
jgi:hypothetical protein